MGFLTNDKLVIVGAAGMIGSNMVQTALMMGLTSNICLYDVFSPEGVAEEMRQSGFGDVNITATTDVAEAFKDAKYIISSGGAPRKAGMTREDLLKGNCEIAEQLGKNIKFLRKSKNLSQEKLAELINRSRNYVGMIERAEVNTPVDTLFDIAKALHSDIKKLFE